jgi:hypothetical protein
MSFILESCRRIGRLRPVVLAALTLTAACGDADPTSPVATDEMITVLPVSDAAADVPLASASFAGGIPLGNFDQPLSEFGSIFNGSHDNTAPNQLVSALQQIKSRGGKVILALSGSPKYYLDGKYFSMAKWKERVNRYRGINFKSYIDDGTIIGHYLIDEPNDPANWGGRPVSSSAVEEMAKYSKDLWPGMATIVRAEPKFMGDNHRYLDAAWAQYLSRRGNVNEYIKDVVAMAQRKGLQLVVGLNVLKGGNPNGTNMTASEVESWGSALLSSSYPCAFINWKYSGTYMNNGGIRSAMSDLRRKAESRSSKSCGA